ncbi:hypothetical protein ABZ368_18650 [Streptomyces sp. NPDC005908]|uniref:hypothetical protein n=1 Tax=Streptomyces sp. NPDC005908 TaxID=3157084 RepID=UPI0033FD4B1B
MRESRRSVRDFFRTDVRAAHLGAALFTVALTVGLLTGRRGLNAVRTAYKVTFGWTSWI